MNGKTYLDSPGSEKTFVFVQKFDLAIRTTVSLIIAAPQEKAPGLTPRSQNLETAVKQSHKPSRSPRLFSCG